MRRTAAQHAAPESALARLLEVETRLEAMLEEAHLAAEATLRDARARAASRSGALAAELAAAESEVASAVAAQIAAQVAREEAALTRTRSRYERVDDRSVEALAAWVFDQVLAAAGTESP